MENGKDGRLFAAMVPILYSHHQFCPSFAEMVTGQPTLRIGLGYQKDCESEFLIGSFFT